MSEPIALALWADLPCPFCGGRAELHKELRAGHEAAAADAFAYFYVCASCAAVGGWGKSETSALRMWRMRGTEKYCRGEGCPRADLCRRHMDAARVERPTYFEKSPLHADGQCGEFAANGWIARTYALKCSGAHPPPQCAWQCEIEVHRWTKRGDDWVWTASNGVER